MRLLPFFLAVPALAQGAVETLVETFNGDGPYQSITNDLVGFDNPGWEVYSDDGFANGGLHLQNDGGYEDTDADGLERVLTGVGSFRTRIELKNLNLGDFEVIPVDSSGKIAFDHWLDENTEQGAKTIDFTLQESFELGPLWDLSFGAGNNRAGRLGSARRAHSD
jgi:hypothetical protein